MTTGPCRYFSYMLRLWQVKTDGGLVWRASLESPKTSKRRGFTDLDALFAFITAETVGPGPFTGERKEIRVAGPESRGDANDI